MVALLPLAGLAEEVVVRSSTAPAVLAGMAAVHRGFANLPVVAAQVVTLVLAVKVETPAHLALPVPVAVVVVAPGLLAPGPAAVAGSAFMGRAPMVPVELLRVVVEVAQVAAALIRSRLCTALFLRKLVGFTVAVAPRTAVLDTTLAPAQFV